MSHRESEKSDRVAKYLKEAGYSNGGREALSTASKVKEPAGQSSSKNKKPTGYARGGLVDGDASSERLDRPSRSRKSDKGGSKINIVIAAPAPKPAPDLSPGEEFKAGLAAAMNQGQGGQPPAPPPPPGAGLVPGMPPGAPIPGMKTGGRMTAGAGGGEGRLQKAAMARKQMKKS